MFLVTGSARDSLERPEPRDRVRLRSGTLMSRKAAPAFVRGRPALILLSLLIAGCAAPTAPRDDAGGADAALPSSVDVDLHAYVLNITMPEGQPTMLVTMNVTKDMWVRPFAGGYGLGSSAPAENPAYWILCPWVKSYGLPNDVHYHVLPFWLQGRTLDLAVSFVRNFADTTAAEGLGPGNDGRCATYESTDRPLSIAADEPLDGKLVLLLTAKPDEEYQTSGVQGDQIPAFSIVTGIARATCSDDATSSQSMRRCPPDQEQEVEPTLRGGVPVYSFHNALERKPCDDCGFVISDQRTGISAAAVGSLNVNRTGAVAHGVSFAYLVVGWANPLIHPPDGGVPGNSRFEATLSSDDEAVNATCAAHPPVGCS